MGGSALSPCGGVFVGVSGPVMEGVLSCVGPALRPELLGETLAPVTLNWNEQVGM